MHGRRLTAREDDVECGISELQYDNAAAVHGFTRVLCGFVDDCDLSFHECLLVSNNLIDLNVSPGKFFMLLISCSIASFAKLFYSEAFRSCTGEQQYVTILFVFQRKLKRLTME